MEDVYDMMRKKSSAASSASASPGVSLADDLSTSTAGNSLISDNQVTVTESYHSRDSSTKTIPVKEYIGSKTQDEYSLTERIDNRRISVMKIDKIRRGTSKSSSSKTKRPAMVGMDGKVRVVKIGEGDNKPEQVVIPTVHKPGGGWQDTLGLPKENKQSLMLRPAYVETPFKSTWLGSILIGIVFLCTFGGVFMSVLGTLGCEFLGYDGGSQSDVKVSSFALSDNDNIFAFKMSSEGMPNRTFTTESSQTATASRSSNNLDNGSGVAWIGIFAYESTAFGEITEQTTASSSTTKSSPFTAAASFCVEYDNEYFFGDAPFKSLYAAQICAILAPAFCLISFLLFFLDFADICDNQLHRHIRKLAVTAFALFLLGAILQALCLIIFLEPDLCERESGDGTEYACTLGTNAWLVVASSICFFVCAVALLTYYWAEEKYYFRMLLKNDFLPEDATDSDSSGNDNFNLYDGYEQQKQQHRRKSSRKSRNRRLHPNHPAIATMQRNILQKIPENQYVDDMEANLQNSDEEDQKNKRDMETRIDDFLTCQDDFDFICGVDEDGRTVLSR